MKNFIKYLERGYRDCDKIQDKDIYTVHCMMHQALEDIDQTRKYGISGASCGILYILVLYLVLFMQSLYTLSNFHLLVIITVQHCILYKYITP